MRSTPLERDDLKAHTEAMLTLAAAINSLVQSLPQRGLGGLGSTPLFTVECRCSCGQRSTNPPYLPYAY